MNRVWEWKKGSRQEQLCLPMMSVVHEKRVWVANFTFDQLRVFAVVLFDRLTQLRLRT